jgi:hypothetical protein
MRHFGRGGLLLVTVGITCVAILVANMISIAFQTDLHTLSSKEQEQVHDPVHTNGVSVLRQQRQRAACQRGKRNTEGEVVMVGGKSVARRSVSCVSQQQCQHSWVGLQRKRVNCVSCVGADSCVRDARQCQAASTVM